MKRITLILMVVLIALSSRLASSQTQTVTNQSFALTSIDVAGRIWAKGNVDIYNSQYALIEAQTGNSFAAYEDALYAQQQDAAERVASALDEVRQRDPVLYRDITMKYQFAVQGKATGR